MNEEKNANKSDVAKQEEEILEFWQKNEIFKKSLEKPAPNGEFVFYDGPPFATGLPHYGHLLGGTMKDIIPRYQTMKGKRVRRRWGWDCHGLPIENLIEAELGLKTKKDIYKHGVEKFNQAAKDSVLRYDADWKKIVPRTGRWVDMDNSYQTMDTSYSESIWWIFKNIYDKKLIYEGHKAMHLCPRCETTLSNFEVNQGYKDIKDLSVTVKFHLKSKQKWAGGKYKTKDKVYILAWTTTPWTLPGNVALAVGEDIKYTALRVDGIKELLIIATDRIKDVFKDRDIEIVHDDVIGKDLIGLEYESVFDYYSNDESLKNRENGWKIYGADFVNTEDGTGVIHIAPAFGSDDMELGKKENLPFVQHVSVDGRFTDEVKDFTGLEVKPKDDHMSTDIEIIKNLAHRELLFAKEKITHSYPHCWRCDTPLLNYAASSWFLKVTDLKENLIKVNQGINWVPKNIKDGRFGKWLEGVRDWAISRTRFWGAPLPVWKCDKCEKTEVLGSIEDLRKKTKSTNRYFLIRHGEADNNTKNIISTQTLNDHHLTEKGKEQVAGAIKELKDKKIDLIISSPFVRTKETAEMIAEGLDMKKEEIIYEEGIREINLGEMDGKSNEDYHKYFESQEEKFHKNPPSGENLTELKNRVAEFIYETDKKYSNKVILIVTHEYPYWLMMAVAQGLNPKKSVELKEKENLVGNAEVRELDFAPLPHNKNYEVDLHMPYIDEIKFACDCGDQFERIPEVFDCWFESGAMPYASNHYPFENLDVFDPEKGVGFPADFIAEGQDQTRGWFYTSLVLSTALFGKSSYQNVVVNGMVLTEDGKEMSKRLKNYPKVSYILDKYGADAMRYYLINSPVVHAEDLNFSEKGVDEVLKKIILRTKNIYSFYELYKDNLKEKIDPQDSKNVLDKWILARLNELIGEVTIGLDNYELDRASRPILDFIDDFSVWYIRRSRDRFKGGDGEDKNYALVVTQFVLQELSKTMAPFMPFIAEEIYQNIGGKKESVHLDDWPQANKLDEKILEDMEKVRNVVSLALEARATAGLKVRQPLSKFTVYSLQFTEMDKQLLDIIKDEVNVKDIMFEKGEEMKVELDTKLTPELKSEGQYRELLRNIQRMRKNEKLVPSDLIELEVETNEEGKKLIEKFVEDLKKTAGIKEIEFESAGDGEEIKIDGFEFKLKIDK